MLTFEAPWTTRNTWGAPQIFFRNVRHLISDPVLGGVRIKTKLLLCRVASYTGTACQMWSVPIAGRQQQHDTPFHVAPVEDGCTPSATLEAGLVGDAKTLVKQDCCLHTILS